MSPLGPTWCEGVAKLKLRLQFGVHLDRFVPNSQTGPIGATLVKPLRERNFGQVGPFRASCAKLGESGLLFGPTYDQRQPSLTPVGFGWAKYTRSFPLQFSGRGRREAARINHVIRPQWNHLGFPISGVGFP